MIKASKRSKTVGHPLVSYFDRAAELPVNQSLAPLNLLSGTPSTYDPEIRMPAEGYQILRDQIKNPGNHGYSLSDGLACLRETVASTFFKGKVPKQDVKITTGVQNGLLTVLLAATVAGDKIAVPDIGFPYFEQVAPALGRSVVKYRVDEKKNFDLDLDSLQKLLKEQRPRLLYVVNPANPTGSVFTREHLQAIYRLTAKYQCFILADQIYWGQARGRQFVSFADVYETHPIFVASGSQKLFCVPGWAISWLVILDQDKRVPTLRRAIDNMCMIFLHPNVFLQQAVSKIIPVVGTKLAQRVGSHPYLLLPQLQTLPGLHAYPSSGLFAAVQVDLARLKLRSDIQFVELLARQQSVLLLPLSLMGRLSGFRLPTIANQHLGKELLCRLRRFIQKHSA